MNGTPGPTQPNLQNNLQNIIPQFKTPGFLYPALCVIIFLIITMFLILYKVDNPFKPAPKSKQELTANIFGLTFFAILVFGLTISFLPNFSKLRELLIQISGVTYAIIYIVFLILFFSLFPKDILDKYSYIIVPILLVVGGFLFYKGATTDYASQFNVNYERIKAIILLFCFIVGAITYYNVDPGGYIHKTFGYSLLLTIIISIFAFLYLMVLFALPESSQGQYLEEVNFLKNFSKFGVYNTIAFFIFIVTVTVIISTYKGGFFKDTTISMPVMVLLLLICIAWSLIIGTNLFPEIGNGITSNTSKINLFKRSLLALFGVIISSLIIFWIVYNVQHISGKSGIVSLILNVLLVVIILGLIYKTINVQLPHGNTKKTAFFNIILNTILYIPCIFTDFFDAIGAFISGDYDSSTSGSLIMIVACIVLTLLYFGSPNILNFINLQGGKQLIDKPVPLDSQYSLGTYTSLNGSDQFDYQYAISCWVYIDSLPPNTNTSYNKYTSVLNFGDKPNILYNSQAHTLMIVTQQKDLEKNTTNKLTDFDENGNRIIYMNKVFMLQKWNNIIINYSGGVLDIFLNGELVKSDIGVVPYYTLDNLTVGEKNGIKGGICNVVYFKRALTASNIFYLYNIVKANNPPIISDSNKTLLSEPNKSDISLKSY
jgi:Concanavalin A-like lectin/glucanases superfamily